MLLVPAEASEQVAAGRAAVMVDVLRSATTMATALDAGCREIIPASGIEEARRLADTLGRDHVLLCGEREGRRIEGFDLGNSPLEFLSQTVGDRAVIMTTTNGTPVISQLRQASLVAAAGLVNVSAVYQVLKKSGLDAVVVCAGKLGRFSLEDAIGAGAIADQAASDKYILGDGAKVARMLFRKYRKNLLRILSATEHGAYLLNLGFGDDIAFCASLDRTATVPVLYDGRIISQR